MGTQAFGFQRSISLGSADRSKNTGQSEVQSLESITWRIIHLKILVVLGTAQLSRDHEATFTTSTLAAGSTKVTATFSGDSNTSGSAASVTQTVQQ
jgi:hypothetical protein